MATQGPFGYVYLPNPARLIHNVDVVDRPSTYYVCVVNSQDVRRRLDRVLSGTRVPARPSRGWLRAIRDALGMSGRQLGDRIGVSQQRVSKIEQSEADGTITLNSLRDAADALGCELVYALVPRTSLQGLVVERARQKAKEIVGAVDRTMRLEDQQVDPRATSELLESTASRLIGRRDLWS